MLLPLLLLFTLLLAASCGCDTKGELSSASELTEPTDSSRSESLVVADSEVFAPAVSEETSSEAEISVPERPIPPVNMLDGEPFVMVPDTREDLPLPIRAVKPTLPEDIELFGAFPQVTPATVQKLTEALLSFPEGCALFLYTLDGTQALCYRSETEFPSASVVKAAFAYYCCLAIDQGLVSRDEKMFYEPKHYHEGDGGVASCLYGTPFTLEELIRLTLSISDNTAYYMLCSYFGHDGYNKLMTELGCDALKLGATNWTRRLTARDTAILWRELYAYFQTDSPMARVYRDACTDTGNNYLTKRLRGVSCSHKYGLIEGQVCHDSGILWAERPYILVVLSSAEGQEDARAQVSRIARLIHSDLLGMK